MGVGISTVEEGHFRRGYGVGLGPAWGSNFLGGGEMGKPATKAKVGKKARMSNVSLTLTALVPERDLDKVLWAAQAFRTAVARETGISPDTIGLKAESRTYPGGGS